ncbi:arsenic transporter [Helicobacter sp. MIT 11-5569]|uniref:arsenic transporter n=1 Tax=Helicobacter sp. MIT 11-5569 TaxID=1548151 RepID=UPI00051F86ED|nr:arsenic transporter [Helicobacter sp. MIT 11-5569]TLD85061.1 arsenic transporter [Helicobacter sp. MIT 11-5569]
MALVVFSLVMLGIYLRPFGIPIWLTSLFGAMLSLGLGSVSLSDIGFVWGMVWNSSFALVGLIVFALALEKLGFFEVLANLTLKLSLHKQNLTLQTWKFYVLIGLLASLLAIFFANDGAILILTPLMIALLKHIKTIKFTRNPLILFLLFVSFISDFASNLFVFSNLTNIITAEFFKIPFLEFAFMMALPQFFAIFSTLGLFWLIFGRRLPKTLEFQTKTQSLPKPFITLFCASLVVLLLVGIISGEKFGIPLSVFTLVAASLSVICGILTQKIQLLGILKEAPLSIVVFSLGLFVVVFGLKNMGLVEFLREEITRFSAFSSFFGILSVGFASSFGASVINNLPMVMLGDLALLDSAKDLVFAHLLGCNIGAKLTPIGSLATLLWLASLKRYGIHISFLQYMFASALITLPVLCCALLGLYFYAIL